MLVKFIARGTGSAQAAADYLTRETDSQGAVRDDVTVLRGDPDQVAAVADALAFEHKYTSGVIAWAPEDQPSDQDIGRVLDEFEQTAWAGLAPDRYAWAAVRHREADGGVHVHVLAARCDLETGKSLNIAPPGWEQTYGPLVEACNLDQGWSRPDDPARARVQQPGHRAYREAAALRAGIAHEADPRDQIQDYLLQRVEAGTVRDRAGVVAALQEAGLEVPRQGDHYVTVRDPDTEQRWRLKGALYEHDFQRDRFERPAPAPDRDREPEDGRDRRARAAAVWRDVERKRASQAAYRRGRYGDRDRADSRAAAIAARAAVARPARGPGDRGEHLAHHLRRELGVDAVAVHPRADPARDAGDPAARARAGTGRRSTNSRRRHGAWSSTRRRTGRGTCCCPRGRSARSGPGPCKGGLPCRCRASEGVV